MFIPYHSHRKRTGRILGGSSSKEHSNQWAVTRFHTLACSSSRNPCDKNLASLQAFVHGHLRVRCRRKDVCFTQLVHVVYCDKVNHFIFCAGIELSQLRTFLKHHPSSCPLPYLERFQNQQSGIARNRETLDHFDRFDVCYGQDLCQESAEGGWQSLLQAFPVIRGLIVHLQVCFDGHDMTLLVKRSTDPVFFNCQRLVLQWLDSGL